MCGKDITLQKRQGLRLKSEARKRGLSNKAVGEIVAYHEKTISNIYSGKTAMTDDRFEKLANAWGLRKEYLECIDDFETIDDMEYMMHSADIDSFKARKDYLETLGYKIVPEIVSRVDKDTAVSLLKSGVLERFCYSDSVNDVKEKIADPAFNGALVKWARLPQDMRHVSDRISDPYMNDAILQYSIGFLSEDLPDVIFEMRYEIILSDTEHEYLSYPGLMLLFKFIDSHSKITIENMVRNYPSE